jgi:hypothetical protein
MTIEANPSEIQDFPDIKDLARKISELGDFVLSPNYDESGVENKSSPGTFNVSFATCPNDSDSQRTTFVYLDCSSRLYQELTSELEKLTGVRMVSSKRECSLPWVTESTRFSGESSSSERIREMVREYNKGFLETEITNEFPGKSLEKYL